jgi:hypothetical protein
MVEYLLVNREQRVIMVSDREPISDYELVTNLPEVESEYLLLTSERLLDPEVGAVLIGKLEPGAYEEVKQAMEQAAQEHGVLRPAMIADIIFKEGKQSAFGSTGKPYQIRNREVWEVFARDVPEYCGEKVPSVYMVDRSKYTTGV